MRRSDTNTAAVESGVSGFTIGISDSTGRNVITAQSMRDVPCEYPVEVRTAYLTETVVVPLNLGNDLVARGN